MKVILLQDIKGLGKTDEVKEVADGFARNFLFPKNLAVAGSKKSLKEKESQDKKKVKDEMKELQRQQNLAEKIENEPVEIKAKVSEGNSLYAAINSQIVIKALKKKNINIDKSQIAMAPIKELGEHTIKIKLKQGIEAELNIVILEE